LTAGEDPADAARREFAEEIGLTPAGSLQPLGQIRQRGGKWVHVFAVEGDVDVRVIQSNSFEMEWPPKSRQIRSFPEVDRAEWFDLPAARTKILLSQQPLLERLEDILRESGSRS
jgi:predicted NUDIX family NTP pyrophosphohydrolase